MAVWDVPARIRTIARKIEEILALQKKTNAALIVIDARLRELEDRMTRLESDQTHLVSSAKAAAGVTAAGIASSVVSDVVTRLTRVEMRQEQLQLRLPPAK